VKLGTIGLAILAFLGLSASSCEDIPAAQEKESATQQSTYERLSARQPAKQMTYSPTRATINAWIEKWSQPNKLAYVYLQASNGQLVGYYVTKGLPVSYCASLTPTYRFETHDQAGGYGDIMVPAPGMDGVYYSGGQCLAYYGIDATTGQYMEWTVGTGISQLVYERPLPRQDVEPLGFTEVSDVKAGK